MNTMNVTVQFWVLLVGLICFVFAAFRNGIGRNKTDFVALGLAIWLFVVLWNVGAEAF